MEKEKLSVYFIGGSKLDFFIPRAAEVAADFRQNEWVEIGNTEINSKNVTYYTVSKMQIGGPVDQDEDDDLDPETTDNVFWNR
ncbi:hypothetical protein ACINKY_21460 [Paenibacillus illinoisensis]|uniref:Uncharacterized protein n=1 Tax=Paenibacillus illinoisensis TaxID=59845 RepID=A0ABW8HYN2_9BACL